MRAVTVRALGPFEQVKVEEVPAPTPGPGEVLIEAHAIGVNFPDILVIAGQYQVKPPLPFAPGKEVAGVIAATGEGVARFKPGDRVAAQVEYGAYAEQVVAPAATTYGLPAAMPFDQAAALGLVYQTSWFALTAHAAMKPGEHVFVPGAAGGIGVAAVQLAKALGGTVLAGVAHPEQAEFVTSNGADFVIDLSVPNLRDGLRDQVRAATGGHGADVIVDPVGGDVFDASLRALAWRGRLVVVGFASGRISQAPANYLLVKNIFVSGLQWSDYRDRAPDWVRRGQEEMYRLFEEGKLRPRIMRRYPLDAFADALTAMQKGRMQGKLVLVTDRFAGE